MAENSVAIDPVELALAETRHRMKNDLQLLASWAALGARDATDTRTLLKELTGRIELIARFYQEPRLGEMDFGNELTLLAASLDCIAGARARHIRIAVEACPEIISAELGRILLQIAHELIVNALRHAFGPSGGSIRIRYRCDHGTARLTVEDTPLDAAEAAPTTAISGSGRLILEHLTRRLHGSIKRERTSSGLCVEVAWPHPHGLEPDQSGPSEAEQRLMVGGDLTPPSPMEPPMDDRRLRQEIIAELDYDPSLDSARIGVSVTDGVVMLSGHVPNYAQKYIAEMAVKRVKGVHAIAEELKVDLCATDPWSDEDIARRAADVLDSNVLIPRGRVTVQVQQGWLSLSGELDWNFERTAAEDDVRKLRGVVGVANLLTVKPHVDVADVERRIGDALRRSADVEAESIQVTAKNGRVRLEGKVKSWTDRKALETAAWSARGVIAVEDRVHISAL